MHINSRDYVLEIGSGHHPRMRSDVLCDKFIEDDSQRGGAIATDRPIIQADGENLPFAGNSFDYVICSHVLEHMEDPESLFGELARVARRGYIETPSEIAERLFGWPFHKWIINLVDGQLVLRRNVATGQFGQLFHAFAARDPHFIKFCSANRSIFVVRHEWSGSIDFRITQTQASPDCHTPEQIEAMLARANHSQYWRRWSQTAKMLIPRRFRPGVRSFLARHRPAPTKRLQDIIVCPVCKGEVAWQTDSCRCGFCDVDYPIIDNIPRLLPAHSKAEVQRRELGHGLSLGSREGYRSDGARL